MTAAQRVLGRSVQAAAGGLVGPIGVGWVDGQRYEIDLVAPPGRQARPVLPCGCVDACSCWDDDGPDVGTDMQERQG